MIVKHGFCDMLCAIVSIVTVGRDYEGIPDKLSSGDGSSVDTSCGCFFCLKAPWPLAQTSELAQLGERPRFMGTMRDDSDCADDTRICGDAWLLLGSIRFSHCSDRLHAFQSSGHHEYKVSTNCSSVCNCYRSRHGCARSHSHDTRNPIAQPQIPKIQMG